MDERRERMYDFMADVIRVCAGVEDLAKQVEENRRAIAALSATTDSTDDGAVDATAIIEFLRARLDEDEGTARTGGEARIAWLTYRDDVGQMRYTTVASAATDDVWIAAGAETPAPSSVLVVYDPARVLHDVQSRRTTLVRCQEEMLSGIPRLVWFARMIVWEMAQRWADHEAFNEGWKP